MIRIADCKPDGICDACNGGFKPTAREKDALAAFSLILKKPTERKVDIGIKILVA
jgi:hypothetical protein